VEIVRVGTIDEYVAEFSRFAALELHHAVDLRRIRARAADARLVDQHLQVLPTLRCSFAR
jgi:hypothetical protein